MLRTLLLALIVTPLAAPPAAAWDLPFFGSSEEKAPQEKPGGREWWKKHKKKAVLVPQKGYQVPGFDGYYDGNGVPIDASVDEQSIRLGRFEEEAGGLLPGLDPKKAAKAVRDAAGYGPDERVARALLAEGVALFGQQKYAKAADEFEAAANRWPNSDLAAKALFNLGEAHFFDNDFEPAADAYISLLDKHPSTPKLDAAVERLWTIAQYWERSHFSDDWRAPFDFNATNETRPKLDTIGHAIRLYEAIRLNDPTGPRAADAIMATAGIHFRRKRFIDADHHYTLLREEYPRSKHQFEAHLLGLQAKLQRYHGPDYDGTPLREAERLEELTRVNFSGRLTDEQRDRLVEVRAQIARAIEERDLRRVEFYEGTDQIASARYYLRRFTEEHPESPAVDQAREQLAAYEGLPDSPDVPMEWLVNLFPENKRFESIRSVEEAAPAGVPEITTPDGDRTMVADGSAGDTTTR